MPSNNSTMNVTTRKSKKHAVMQGITGSMATCCACIFSNPFDVFKTRLQLQGEMGKGNLHYRGVFDVISATYRHEGIHGIQRGLSAALWFNFVLNGVRFGLYPAAQSFLASDPTAYNFFFKNIAAGAIAGAASAFVA